MLKDYYPKYNKYSCGSKRLLHVSITYVQALFQTQLFPQAYARARMHEHTFTI